MKKFFSRLKNHPFGMAYADNANAIISLLTVLAVMRLLPFGDRLRNILPEPFDVVDHVSNLVLSIGIAYYLTIVLAAFLYMSRVSADRSLMFSRVASVIFIATLNALFETQAGIDIVNSSTTPDSIDLGYGIIGGVVGSALVGVVSGPKLDSTFFRRR